MFRQLPLPEQAVNANLAARVGVFCSGKYLLIKERLY